MPWDRSKYPEHWNEIRREILDRAGHRCEWGGCGVANYALGHWDGERFIAAHNVTGGPVGLNQARTDGLVRIILTIAHIGDPDPQNVDPANLAALCQRHHNRLDAPMRARNAAATRRARFTASQTKAGQQWLIRGE